MARYIITFTETRYYDHTACVNADSVEEARQICESLAHSRRFVEDRAGNGNYFDTEFEAGEAYEASEDELRYVYDVLGRDEVKDYVERG